MYEFYDQGDRELFDKFCRDLRYYPEGRMKDAFIVALREARREVLTIAEPLMMLAKHDSQLWMTLRSLRLKAK